MQAWAELVCIPAQFVYHMPSGMSFQDGAALLMNYLTAHLLLFEIGNLRNGQSVLVHSVGGGVVSTALFFCSFYRKLYVDIHDERDIFDSGPKLQIVVLS